MRRLFVLLVVAAAAACGGGAPASSPPPAARPWILLVTLDTTRADAIGPEAAGVETPAFNALASQGLRFRQAYATVPETFPSHASMMTGLYPGGHGVHENGRSLAPAHAVLAERLQQAGYRTLASVSSFSLARRFGLARGFEAYDDLMPEGKAERSSKETTDRTIATLPADKSKPLFLWVHYFDPHAPYTPPEPCLSRYPTSPYLGEVACMDTELARLVAAFTSAAPAPPAIIVVGDHGEGLGDHGEAQHGTLLYQSTMHVPLVIAGPGIAPAVSDVPVSTRRVYNTILDWAGVSAEGSLRAAPSEVVLGEAMKPFLEYGWQPQVMTIDRTQKAILAGRVEIYDVAQDPREQNDLSLNATLPPPVPAALRDYPIPSPVEARAPVALDSEAQRQLASLGYVSAGAAPVVRRDAPRPVDMAPMLELIDRASGLFVREQYAQVIPLLRQILAKDPGNLDAVLRLATAHSALGHDAEAIAAFRKAADLAPQSPDVRLYLALHYARGRDWTQAVPMLEGLVAADPTRVAAIEALATLRERQERPADAMTLRQQAYGLRAPSAAELVQLGLLAMRTQQTPVAIDAFTRARQMEGAAFAHDLELGVLYLDARRLTEARDALDRVPASSRDYPMALFKRAQVSVLLNEPDRAARIDAARRHADATTRPLIANERLFR